MNMRSRPLHRSVAALGLAILLIGGSVVDVSAKKKKNKKGDAPTADPYAEYVWPPPPDEPRIKLEAVIRGRVDVEAKSNFRRKLLMSGPQSQFDWLNKPFAVDYDPQGRILVTDSGNSALLRFDREGKRMDVFGTQGRIRLSQPLGLDVSKDGTIYVADGRLNKIVAFDSDGKVIDVYGKAGDLTNPTDVAVSPGGGRLYVADSKAHQIVVFDRESGEIVNIIGKRGEGPGEFSWPTSLAFDDEANLLVVDQINSRVQRLTGDGEFIDQIGQLGVGFANFVRPKDIAVDEVGFIYVTDNAFNNVQLFDSDFTLLTFVGAGGDGPGFFHGASGVAVKDDQFAVVDQLGQRLQIFRFLVPKNQ